MAETTSLTMRPVLNYHAVGTTESRAFRPWVVSSETLERQLDLLVARGKRGVTMAEMLRTESRDAVALTFDDAYADFLELAVPVLQKFDFGATLFVPTAHIGASAQWLEPDVEAARPLATWDDIRVLHREGIEIGSHSHTHPMLDLLSPPEVAAELGDSRALLSAELGVDVAGFCYPHGFHGAAVRQGVIDAGYEYACAVKHEMSHSVDDRFAIARIVITNDIDDDQFCRFLSGDGLPLARPGEERIRTKVFRQYRRARAGASR